MKLKQVPEDFIVEEIPGYAAGGGAYTILKVVKKGMNSEDAARLIAQRFHVQRKDVGYAGAKDRQAVTTQYMSVKGGKDSSFSSDTISVEIIGKSPQPLSLGDLKGNTFKIIVRDLEEESIIPSGTKKKSVPNYYGEQRFGRRNVVVGRALVKKNFDAAGALIAQDGTREGRMVADALLENPTEPLAALQKLPKHTLRLYLHSYQSWLWNETLTQHLKNKVPEGDRKVIKYPDGAMIFLKEDSAFAPINIPLIGFGMDVDALDDDLKPIIQELLWRERLSPRDFIIKQLRGLSPEGGERAAVLDVEIAVGAPAADELNSGKHKQELSFALPPGSYATIVIAALF